jgi:hypothetical protein
VYIDSINTLATTISQPLNLLTAPTPATNIRATNITTTSFDLTWSGTDGSTSLTIYYTGNSYTIQTPSKVTSVRISNNVQPNTSYTISIDAINSNIPAITNTDPANYLNFTTPNVQIGPQGLAQVAATTSVSTVGVTWQIDPQVVSYNYAYTLPNNTVITNTGNPPIIIYSLTGNTIYPFILTPQYTSGPGPVGQINTLTAPVQPHIYNATASTDSINLSWTGSDGANQLIVYYRNTSNTVNSSQTINVPANTTINNTIISNLPTSSNPTTYTINIDATNSNIPATSPSNIIDVQTTAYIPGAPTGLQQVAVLTSVSSVGITWNLDLAIVSSYTYYIDNIVTSAGSTKTVPVQIDGLSGNTNYRFYLLPNFFNTSVSPTSAYIDVITAPNPAINIRAPTINPTSLNLAWNGTDGAHTLVIYYNSSSPNLNQQVTITGPTNSATISTLQPYTTYTIYIDATNSSIPATTPTAPINYLVVSTSTNPPQNLRQVPGQTTATSLQIAWDTDPTPALSYYLYTFDPPGPTLPQPGQFKQNNLPVSNLLINQLYTFTLTPYFTNNYKGISATIPVHTGPGPAINLSSSNIGPTSFDLYWDGAEGATSLTYSYNSQSQNISPPPISPKNLNNLTPNTTYTVSIFSINSYCSTPSQSILVQTAPTNADIPPTPFITISNITSSSFRATYTAMSTIYLYQLNCSNGDITASQNYNHLEQINVNLPINSGQNIINANSYYSVTVTAINPTVNPKLSSFATVPVLTAPYPFLTFVATNITMSSFNAFYIGGAGATSIILYYSSYYNSLNTVYTPPPVPPLTSLPITSLSSNTAYYVYLVGLNSDTATNTQQVSTLSNNITVVTAPNPNPILSTINSSTLELVWTYENGATYSYTPLPGATPINIGNNRTILTDLTQATLYTTSFTGNAYSGPAFTTVSLIAYTPIRNPSINIDPFATQYIVTWQASPLVNYSYLSNPVSNPQQNTNPIANPTSPLQVSPVTQNTRYIFTLYAQFQNQLLSTISTVLTAPIAPPITISEVTGTTFVASWLSDPNPITYSYVFNNNPSVTVPTSPPNQLIRIPRTLLLPNRPYTVTITAQNATNQDQSQVTVTTGPAAAINLQASNISTNRFTLRWSGAVGASSLIFYYNDESLPAIDATQVFSPIIISSLRSNTLYRTYINAINGFGATSSNTLSVTTLIQPAPRPPNEPQNVVQSNTSASSFTITWNNDPNADYYKYKLAGGTPLYEISTTGWLLNNVTFTGLTGNTKYNFSIRGVNVAGEGIEYTLFNCLTAPDIPNPIFTTVTQSTFLVTWSFVQSVKHSFTCTDGSSNTSMDDSVISQQIQNLTANTLYSFSFTAFNPSGSNSYTISTYTYPINPDPYFITQNQEITYSTLTVNWTQQIAPNVQTSYLLFASSGPNPPNPPIQTPPQKYNGLLGNTLYYYTLTTKNPSFGLSTTISSYTAPAPIVISYLQENQTSFFINWNYDPNLNTTYTLTPGPSQPQPVTSPPQLTIGGLIGNTQYTFIITATNSVGSATSTVSILTQPPDLDLFISSGTITNTGFAGVWTYDPTLSYFITCTNQNNTQTFTPIYSPPVPVATFSGLQSDTVYIVTLIATNVKNGSTSKSVTVKTISIPPVLERISDLGYQPYTIAVRWTGAANATSYTYKLNPSPPNLQIIDPQVYNIPTKSTFFTSLDPGSTYTITVTANYNYPQYNEFASNSATLTNQATYALKPIITASNITQTGFTLSWQSNIGATSYTYSPIQPTTNNGLINQTAIFTGLTPGYTNQYIVTAENSVGNLSPSLPLSITTLTPTIPPPTQPVINRCFANAISFSIGWTGGDGATSYLFDISGTRVTPGTYLTGLKYADFGVSDKRGDIAYSVVATAVNAGGNSPPSPSFTVYTAPVAIYITSIAFNKWFYWSGPRNDNDVIAVFYVDGIETTPTYSTYPNYEYSNIYRTDVSVPNTSFEIRAINIRANSDGTFSRTSFIKYPPFT